MHLHYDKEDRTKVLPIDRSGDRGIMTRDSKINGRRKFLALCGTLAVSLFAAGHTRRKPAPAKSVAVEFVGPPAPTPKTPAGKTRGSYTAVISDLHPDKFIVDNLPSARAALATPEAPDIILSPAQLAVFQSVRKRLTRLQRYVGFGNFNVIGWDQSLRIAGARSQIGAFTRTELDFIEELFFTNADNFGFFGDKVVTQLSATIAQKDIVKIPGSGHYLFKGPALETYRKIRKDVGNTVVLTSGIRSVVKQIHLFLNKAARVDGNLSLASYSLAPPGHSYHAIGDFDVGKQGYGGRNFSADFARTDEFRRLADLGYVAIRYPRDNPFGVRYEPWHIKVV